jgi:hypothetical protein
MRTADTLATKWARAETGVKETGDSYLQLTERLDVAWIDDWTKQETIAMQNRGDDLKIYQVTLNSGKTKFKICFRSVSPIIIQFPHLRKYG